MSDAIHEMRKDICETHIIGSRSREWRLSAGECRAMAGCGMAWAGWTRAVSRYEFIRTRPDFDGVIICEGGSGQVLINGEWKACGGGQAYLLPSGALHGYRARVGKRWSICWVAFQKPVSDMVKAPTLVPADPRPVRGAIDGLQREVTGRADPVAIQNWVELIRIYSRRIAQPQQQEEDRLWRLWEQVDADLSHPWDVHSLAGSIGTSNEHLRRLCRAGFGRSPMRQVTQLRVRRAAALLVSTNQKVEAIARTVGYSDAFAFSIAFKRHTGMSPTSYRHTSGLKEIA